MSCPCGRGDYALCVACPYSRCSVHGTPPVSSPPEAEPPGAVARPYRKFNVGAAGRSRVYMRCWVCGAPAEFGRPDEWVGLEELTSWAEAHACSRNLAVSTAAGGPDVAVLHPPFEE
jgi:hypothetical protein